MTTRCGFYNSKNIPSTPTTLLLTPSRRVIEHLHYYQSEHSLLELPHHTNSNMCRLHSLSTPLVLLSCLLFFTLHRTTAVVIPVDNRLIQIANASFVSHGQCPFGSRPVVPLPGDGYQKDYKTSSGLNCLDNGSPHEAECWDILQLDGWLALWFSKTPQCPLHSASEFACNKQDPPEPWTTTFMRVAMGGGEWNGCSEVGNANCQYNPYPCLGEGDTDLTKARYKYVAYTISRMSTRSLRFTPESRRSRTSGN